MQIRKKTLTRNLHFSVSCQTLIAIELRLTQSGRWLIIIFLSSCLLLSNTWAADVSHVDGKKLLRKYCSQCHAPPLAKSHKPGRWKNVILRMQNHRLKRGYKLIPESDIILLSRFLDRQAKTGTSNTDIKMDSKK